LREHVHDLILQFVIAFLTFSACFVVYSSMKPVIKGACRIVLQTDESLMDSMRGRIVGVEAHRAITGTTQREVKSIGILKANAEAVIKSEVPGKIAEILFEEGSEVQKGQDLIKFEDDYFRAEKEKSEAAYTLQKAEFERNKKLFDQKVGSQKTYDESYAKLTEAKAQLDIAAFQLARTTIKAPFSGTIGIMKGAVTPGNIVQQHTELVDLVDNSAVRVEFPVPAKYIEDIAVGQNVEITVDAFVDRVFYGAVVAIDSEVDTRNHSVLVRAVIPNKENILRHGLFANVKLITGEKSNVVLVDDDALDREGSIEFVWVIDEKGRAGRRRVYTGARNDNGVEIIDGVASGEMVVTAGQLKLTDGVVTNILNKDSGTLPNKRADKAKVGDTELSDFVAPEDVAQENTGEQEQEATKKDKTADQEATAGDVTTAPEKATTDKAEPKTSKKDGSISTFFKNLFTKKQGKAEKKAERPTDAAKPAKKIQQTAKAKTKAEVPQTLEKQENIVTSELDNGDAPEVSAQKDTKQEPSKVESDESSSSKGVAENDTAEKKKEDEAAPTDTNEATDEEEQKYPGHKNPSIPSTPGHDTKRAIKPTSQASHGWGAIKDFFNEKKSSRRKGSQA
jgi:membrane fusion protein (multidrug efflux system)